MPSVRVSTGLNDQIHFVTLTVRDWFSLFDRYDCWIILVKALAHYQKSSSLKIYGYVFMMLLGF